MPPRITQSAKESFYRLLGEGMSIKDAARLSNVSYSWAKQNLAGMPSHGLAFKEAKKAAALHGPVPVSKLKPEARRALDDFEYFRSRYFGHVSKPWHIEAAKAVVEMLDSPHKEYVVMNEPPGSGKTTLVHDIACWVTVRRRDIRGLMGSATSKKAETMLKRVRRSLERVTPTRASAEDKDRGLAVDSEATLCADFGLFKPQTGGDLWRADSFIVLQHGEEMIDEKEPTWSAYGMDQDFLGGRYDLIFWDDLVTTQHVRTLEQIEKQREWWDREAESRLEPGGALFLVGQRVASNDLYRHCLDKKLLPEDDADFEEATAAMAEGDDEKIADLPGKYRHIVYRAHDETRCDNTAHKLDSESWPDGCLLDPRRLAWRDLRAIRANSPAVYATWYQQEDADPQQTLVKHVWVTGGTDPETGTYHPGCWDNDRGLCELPKGLVGPKFSIATVDPSPTKMWAVQWWVYAPEAGHQLFLLDTVRRSMPGNELLDWNNNTQQHYGLMEEWQQRSVALGIPITDWIVEVNAAQRFLLQFDHMRRWIASNRTNVRPHTTTVRKNDADLGVDMTRDWWKFGRIRLPGKGAARTASLKLVEEVQRYPNAYLDDQVMASYFCILHLPELSAGWEIKEPPQFQRPTWLKAVHRGGQAA
jgi:hypothetical protein